MPKDVDLNLLKALRALLEERNVTRAAERIGLSQPATSAALGKLRRHFGDQLLVRVGNGYQVTPLATQLLEQVTTTMTMADRVFSLQPEFDATSAERRFTVVASDYTISTLGPPLSTMLAEHAPGVQLHLRPITSEAVDGAPETLRESDAFVLPHGFLSDLPHTDLITDEWVCLIAEGNTVVNDVVTTDNLAKLSWVTVYHRPTAFTTALRELRMHGVEPKVRLVTESYATLPALLVGTDRITLVQRRLAERLALAWPVRAVPSPVPLAPLKLALWWHPVNTADAGHRWLRGVVEEAARVAASSH
ncbi:LysR family transcriptional regulator [Lentzea pudingi]|uniref:LysR family transcriptional regulator n=1 Tax=Lentzea pudingi TaxID=1789439 RepID=A0ABQ2I0D2_9PSEU|nr:LysR family transcriptional regulator [Lentzea pudingi]GGM94773.1 LysR family transcriptional regulator [Lentzea pudingi]